MDPTSPTATAVPPVRDPVCGMIVDPEHPAGGTVERGRYRYHFCSDRCRKIDLGKWAMGVYKISSPVLDPEVLEDLGELGRQGGNRDDE